MKIFNVCVGSVRLDDVLEAIGWKYRRKRQLKSLMFQKKTLRERAWWAFTRNVRTFCPEFRQFFYLSSSFSVDKMRQNAQKILFVVVIAATKDNRAVQTRIWTNVFTMYFYVNKEDSTLTNVFSNIAKWPRLVIQKNTDNWGFVLLKRSQKCKCLLSFDILGRVAWNRWQNRSWGVNVNMLASEENHLFFCVKRTDKYFQAALLLHKEKRWAEISKLLSPFFRLSPRYLYRHWKYFSIR